MSELQHAAEPATGVPPSVHAPRVKVTRADGGQIIESVLDATANLEDFHGAFLAAFGTTEKIIAEAFFEQLVNALHAHSTKALDTATANLVLALLHRIGPRDELEAMLSSQMIVAHVAAMDASRRALHVEQTAGGRAAYLSLARKLMTLFTVQMDALNRHRGKGTTQKIVIERVLVAPGGQALSARLRTEGGRMGDNSGGQPRDAGGHPFDRLPRCGA